MKLLKISDCFRNSEETFVGLVETEFVGGRCRFPPTPMGTGPLFGSVGGGERTKSGSRQYTRAILPSFGPHGCVKPYCCLFVCIELLLRSDGRCQTERESVPDVSNEPNPLYVALGPPFILSRGHRQVAT